MTLTVNCSQFTVRYPFTVIYEAQWLKANGECMVNNKWLMVNGASGRSVL